MNKTLKVFASSTGRMPYDPYAIAYAIFPFSKIVYDAPIRMSVDGHLKKNVITSWEHDPTNNKWLFTIDKNIKFHNGRPVNSTDFEFMLIRSFISSQEIQVHSWLKQIVGIDSLQRNQKFEPGMCEGIKIISDSTFEVSLQTHNPNFVSLFTRSVPALKPMEELKDDLFTFKNFPLGVGPYKVIETDEEIGVTRLQRREDIQVDYESSGAEFIEIYVKGDPWEIGADIRVGSITGDCTPTDEQKNLYKSFMMANPTSISALSFNYFNKLSQNLNFRSAINHIIDQSQIIQTVPGRFAAFDLNPRLAQKWEPPHNLDLAKKYIEQIPTELLNKELILKYHGPKDKPYYIRQLEKQFTEAGLNITLEQSFQPRLEEGADDHVLGYIYGMPIDSLDTVNLYTAYLPDCSRKFQIPLNGDKFFEAYKNVNLSQSEEERFANEEKLSMLAKDMVVMIPMMMGHQIHAYGDRVLSLGEQVDSNVLDLGKILLKE